MDSSTAPQPETLPDAAFELQESSKEAWQDVDLHDTDLPVLAKIMTTDSEVFNVPEPPIIDQELSIEVQQPQKEGSGWFHSYYVFPIVSKVDGQTYSVKRRYSDFEWLCTMLLDRFKGLSVPKLPPKSLHVTKFELSQRRVGFQQWLEVVAEHPALSGSDVFRGFLQVSNLSELKRKYTIQVHSIPYTSWEDAADQLISKVQSRLVFVFEGRILPFSKTLSHIEAKLRQIEIPTQTMATAFSEWVGLDKAVLKSFQVMTFPHSSLFYQANLEHKQACEKFLVNADSVEAGYQQTTSKLEALKQAFVNYKARLGTFSQLEAAIERKRNKCSSQSERYVQYCKEASALEGQLNTLQVELEETEATLVEEYRWFREDRIAQLDSLILLTAQTQHSRLSFESEFWLVKKHDFINM